MRVGNGITLSTSPGTAIVSVLGSVTGTLRAQNRRDLRLPYRLETGLLDGLGERTSYTLQPITPIDLRTVEAVQVGPLLASAEIAVTLSTPPALQVGIGVLGVAGPAGPVTVVPGSGPPTNDQGLEHQFWIDIRSDASAIYVSKINACDRLSGTNSGR